jgi:Uma2 family endonuclease
MTATTPAARFEPSVMVPLQNIELVPGSPLIIRNVAWEQFESILGSLEDQHVYRIAYYQGTLELMSPLPGHERPHRMISDLVKAILDAEERDWEDFGSTTFRDKSKAAGLEPDTCLYLDGNAQLVRDCMTQMDLGQYPPPDLAIEADVTSKTTLEAYAALGMPEVWVYQKTQISIYLLQAGEYVASDVSRAFPALPILQIIPHWVKRGLTEGAGKTLREFRKKGWAEEDSH